MSDSAKSDYLELEGEFVVAVGDAVVTKVGDDEWGVTYDSPVLHGVESVRVNERDVHAFVDVMYMIQRSCNTEQRQAFPKPLEDLYDAVVYLQASIYADNGLEAYSEEVKQLEASGRFEITPPAWVKDGFA